MRTQSIDLPLSGFVYWIAETVIFPTPKPDNINSNAASFNCFWQGIHVADQLMIKNSPRTDSGIRSRNSIINRAQQTPDNSPHMADVIVCVISNRFGDRWNIFTVVTLGLPYI
jgi:hypothetical protein